MAQARTAEEWIRCLNLTAHPEGGFYREIYRSSGQIAESSLPAGMKGERCYGTAIYFLLRAGQVSRWHRIKSDELWFYHAGCPLEVIVLLNDGVEKKLLLGLDVAAGQRPQVMVPAGCWFGSRIVGGQEDFSLVSCAVAPGFDFQDFQLATTQDTEKWPALWKHPELLPVAAMGR
ncbi:cupin domain-containing protein [Oligoflexus tunisiensis]|uniref:cupin domain-containing protein n=1 Tax=Oligoflexus tunisiensis TaxID=708132 RepID=UPI000ABC2416|nr:cupin domain-containing protein [Oligoflexus tunisiensis]